MKINLNKQIQGFGICDLEKRWGVAIFFKFSGKIVTPIMPRNMDRPLIQVWIFLHPKFKLHTQMIIAVVAREIFARSAEKIENTVFTLLPAGTFALRPSPFKLLLYGPPHFRVILFYGPPHFRGILFYGPPLGIWSPPCQLINDNSLSIITNFI